MGLLVGFGLLFLAVTSKVVVSLVSKEIEGRLDQLPFLILRLARRRLPEEFREAIHDENWVPELHYILQQSRARPITQAWKGLGYAGSLFIKVGRTAKAADPSLRWSTRLARLFKLPAEAPQWLRVAVVVPGVAMGVYTVVTTGLQHGLISAGISIGVSTISVAITLRLVWVTVHTYLLRRRVLKLVGELQLAAGDGPVTRELLYAVVAKLDRPARGRQPRR